MVTEAERTQAQTDFDVMLHQAQAVARGETESLIGPRPTAPKVPEGQQPDAELMAKYLASDRDYSARLAELEKNPLVPEMKRLEALRQKETSEAGKESADGLYDTRIDEIRKKAMDGVDKDLVHESERQQGQQSIVQGFMRGGFLGVIMALLRFIPGVSNVMDVPGQMMEDALNGKAADLDPVASYQNIARGANLQSALMGAVGANPNDANVVASIANIVTPSKPETTTTSQPPKTDEPFNAPNGTMPGAPSVTQSDPALTGPQPTASR